MMTPAHPDRGNRDNEATVAVTVRAGPSENPSAKIMVAIEMPLEFVSHPVMQQVSDDVKTISRYVECNC
jgi:hypothetical protein